MNTILSKLLSMLPSSKTVNSHPAKPFVMKVLVENHAYRCGYGIDDDSQYVTVLRPLDPDKVAQYGERIEIYSKAFGDCLKVGSEISLPFVLNPDYDPANLWSQPLILFVSHREEK